MGQISVEISGPNGSVLSGNQHTPFQRLPPVDAATRYMMALGGKKDNLAYGLDIWHHHKKVLNIEWDENDSNFTLTTYKRGEWEFYLPSE